MIGRSEENYENTLKTHWLRSASTEDIRAVARVLEIPNYEIKTREKLQEGIFKFRRLCMAKSILDHPTIIKTVKFNIEKGSICSLKFTTIEQVNYSESDKLDDEIEHQRQIEDKNTLIQQLQKQISELKNKRESISNKEKSKTNTPEEKETPKMDPQALNFLVRTTTVSNGNYEDINKQLKPRYNTSFKKYRDKQIDGVSNIKSTSLCERTNLQMTRV